MDSVEVEDRDWRVPSEYGRCRMRVSKASEPYRVCPNAPVADLARNSTGRRRHYYAHCGEHLYGRRLERGADGIVRVLIAVAVGSPAAKAGYVGGRKEER
jgi:hypothetical protein